MEGAKRLEAVDDGRQNRDILVPLRHFRENVINLVLVPACLRHVLLLLQHVLDLGVDRCEPFLKSERRNEEAKRKRKRGWMGGVNVTKAQSGPSLNKKK